MKSIIIVYLTKEGYQYVGESEFGGVTRDVDVFVGWGQNDAVKYGRELGACLILYAENRSGTTSMSVPTTMPTSATVTTYTSGGPVTSTVMGSQTSYRNVALPVHRFAAIYAVKLKPGVKPVQSCTTVLGVTECDVPLP